MLEIHLDQTVHIPLYKQIVEQVREMVATNRLQTDEHLPAVRRLAQSLRVNPGTVGRAYLELEHERIVTSRRGRGTIVSARSDDPQVLTMRQRHLSNIISSIIMEVLSLGYRPEDVDATFHLHLNRWCEERGVGIEVAKGKDIRIDNQNAIVIVGSHDIAFELLISQLKHLHPEINIEVNYTGSLGGLIAIQEGRADIAGIHLLDEVTGEYNYPYIKHVLPSWEVAVVHLAYRIQGLIFARDNPRQIKGLEDLRHPGVTFVNRQKGSGTRVLLDHELRQQSILPSEVNGYQQELDTHLAVAIRIARGEADVGMGIEAVARTYNLGFLPLFKEKYDLVLPITSYRSQLLAPLLRIITSEDFTRVVANVGGYDTSQTGATTICER
ncbi:substrate-binding domain-containing protein [Chloroflexota bacterium]